MANPQTENGFIQIATGNGENDILTALIRAKLSGLEYQLVLLVIRKTWGYKKTEDAISLSQFSTYTDKSRRQVIETIKKLVKKNILVKKTAPHKMCAYSFNKDFETWKVVVKKTALVKKTARSSEENRRLGSEENQHPTKETITKESTKEKLQESFELFWKAYPKKKSKGVAEKAFLKVGVGIEVLLEAIELAKKTDGWKKDGGIYIPYPASWLNAKGWEDEVLPEVEKPMSFYLKEYESMNCNDCAFVQRYNIDLLKTLLNTYR